MKRTTVFLPEHLHEQLRAEAHRARVSMAELIRTRLERSPAPHRGRRRTQDPILKVAGVCSGPILSDDIDDALYGG